MLYFWSSQQTFNYYHPILFVFASLLCCVVVFQDHHTRSSSVIQYLLFEGSSQSWASSSTSTHWCWWFLSCLKDNDMSWPTDTARTTWSCSSTPSEHPVWFITHIYQPQHSCHTVSSSARIVLILLLHFVFLLFYCCKCSDTDAVIQINWCGKIIRGGHF